MEKFVGILSGEFFLAHRPNGGTAVLLRSMWVTALTFGVTLPMKSFFAESTALTFSPSQLKVELGEMLPWAGAIFAGAYAAFYARFAAQWSYLAALYNDQMAACVALPHDDFGSNKSLVLWHAAFVEDAQDLHLAGKSMFKSIIVGLLSDGDIVRAFIDSTERGADRLRRLERALRFNAAAPTAPLPNNSPVAETELSGTSCQQNTAVTDSVLSGLTLGVS